MLGRLVNFLLGVMIVGGGECWSVVFFLGIERTRAYLFKDIDLSAFY